MFISKELRNIIELCMIYFYEAWLTKICETTIYNVTIEC